MKRLHLLQMDIDRIKVVLDEMECVVRDSGNFADYGDEAHFGVGEMSTAKDFFDWKKDVFYRLDMAKYPGE